MGEPSGATTGRQSFRQVCAALSLLVALSVAPTIALALPPTVVTPIADQSGTEEVVFGPVDVAGSFDDPEDDLLTFSATGFPGGSGLSISAAGVISGTPTNAAAQASPFNVTVTADDGNGGSVDSTFQFTVADVANPPTVVAPIADQSGTEGVAFGPVSVAANFTDADGDARTFSATGFPGSSGLSISTAGVISGTPTNAAAQASPFNVTVTATTSDGSVNDTFQFTVADAANPPTVVTPIADQSGTEGVAFGPVSVAANFTDADGDARTFSATGFPGSSGLSISTAGVISGTPTNAAAQASPFNVTVTATTSDGSVNDTFQFTVADTANPPTVVTPIADQNGTEGMPFGPISVAANFTDADGDARTFSATGFPGSSGLSISTAGVISGTPTNAAAQASPFNVTVTATTSDGSVNDTFQFTVANVANPPTVVTPIADQSGTEGVAFGPVSVAANFTDADGDARTFSATGFPGSSGLSISTAGVISGTPTNAAAQASPFNVTVTATTSDGSVNDTFQFTVANVANPPTVVTPIADQSGTEGVAFGPVSVAANFTDADGDARTFSATGFPGSSGLSISTAGVISGTPTNAAAQASPFNVTVTATTSDGSVNDTFQFTVANVANPPTVVTPIADQSGTEGVAFGPVSVAANFTDADGDARTFSATGFPGSSGLSISTAGVISGTPTNAAAQASPFNVTVTATTSDGSVNDTFQFTVTNVNDAPTAVADSYSTAEDTTLNVAAPGVLVNDTDPDSGTTLTAVLDTNVTSGTLTLNANGSFSYIPNANFNGADSFTYHANDGSLPSTVVTVNITVTAGNDAPAAVADSYSTAEDTTLNVAVPGVLGNDTDLDTGTTLTAVLNTTTANGTLTLNANGSFSYIPNANFSGADSFTYHANDGSLSGNVVTVTITIANVNDPPFVTSSPQTVVNEDVTYSYTVTATDPDGNPVTFAAPTLPSWLVFTAPATISGTPTQDVIGTHSVTMTVSDGLAPAVQQSFQIRVDSVDDAPVIASIPDQFATELVAFSLNLATFVSDVDTPLSSLVYASTSPLPAGLTLGATGILSGTPALASSIGDFSVGFTVRDSLNTRPAAFNLTVLRAGRADLALSLVATPNPVALNTTTTWTFTITNNAPQVSVGGISLRAVFAGEVPFLFDNPINGCTLTPSGSQTQVACTLGPLAGGATTSVTLTGRGNVAGDVFATATVSIVGPVPIDETPRNDTATGSLSVAQRVSTTPAQSISGLDARAAAAGDLNGDGFVDLVVATGPSQSTVVLLNVVAPNNPNKRVLSDAPITLGDQAANNGIVLADLDGDLDLDIVTATGPGAANRIFLNSGSATFTALTLGDLSEDSRAVAAGDINGDLLTDLVFANGSPSPVYTNQGSAGTFARTALLGNADSRGVVLVDLFGDPLPELVFANADGAATVYRNTAGVFQLALSLPTGPTTSVATADFNNDGRFDLVFGRSIGATPEAVPSNLLWLNTSGVAGSFFLSDELGASPTTAVVVVDIDLDGDSDILAINDTGGHQVYTNVAAASGAFALHPQQIASAGALAAAVGRFSVDARVDAALVGPNGVAVFYNDGSGNLGSGDITAPTIQLRGEPSITLTVEDPYTDAGATATDTIDGDVSARIVVNNPVNPAVIGTYTVTYNATDLSGNSAAPVTRTVRVQARQGTSGGGGGAAGLEFVLLLAFVTVLSRLRPGWRLRSTAS